MFSSNCKRSGSNSFHQQHCQDVQFHQCKSLHSLVEDPKSNESSSSGVILESTSALNTTLSVSASPSVIVPPLNVVVPVTVKFPPMLTFLATPTPPSMITAPVVEPEVDCVVS